MPQKIESIFNENLNSEDFENLYIEAVLRRVSESGRVEWRDGSTSERVGESEKRKQGLQIRKVKSVVVRIDEKVGYPGERRNVEHLYCLVDGYLHEALENYLRGRNQLKWVYYQLQPVCQMENNLRNNCISLPVQSTRLSLLDHLLLCKSVNSKGVASLVRCYFQHTLLGQIHYGGKHNLKALRKRKNVAIYYGDDAWQAVQDILHLEKASHLVHR